MLCIATVVITVTVNVELGSYVSVWHVNLLCVHRNNIHVTKTTVILWFSQSLIMYAFIYTCTCVCHIAFPRIVDSMFDS